MFSSSLLALVSLALLPRALAVGTPFGQAAGTTGGGDATPATPSSNDELRSWLQDDTPRVIVLDRIFDFTGEEGTVTEPGCSPWDCTPNPQLALDADGWCGDNAIINVSYESVARLRVGSNKTVLGEGAGAGLQGAGLLISGVSNVIVQNIVIQELAPQVVFGGDAFYIDNASKVWIDHNHVRHIGRQHFVTGFGAVTETTISYNFFDGDSVYSTGCDGYHYWLGINAGNGDEVTIAKNHFYKTSGRGPHIGGDGTQTIHLYNNLWDDVKGHAIDASSSARVLAEGNVFRSVVTPIQAADGPTYLPQNADQSSACASTLGRNCVPNVLTDSSTNLGTDTGALNSFTAAGFANVEIAGAEEAAADVESRAGTGVVN